MEDRLFKDWEYKTTEELDQYFEDYVRENRELILAICFNTFYNKYIMQDTTKDQLDFMNHYNHRILKENNIDILESPAEWKVKLGGK